MKTTININGLDVEIEKSTCDVEVLKGILNKAIPYLKYHACTLRDRGCSAEYALTRQLISEIERELTNPIIS